jgi:hypothetical protein
MGAVRQEKLFGGSRVASYLKNTPLIPLGCAHEAVIDRIRDHIILVSEGESVGHYPVEHIYTQ